MSTNPNVLILDKAWALLWKATSSYYLPKILANGGTFGSVVIPPMASVQVPDIEPIPLYSSDVWGNVSITLSSMTLEGLPSIQNKNFTPSSDASSVTANVAFGQLRFSGSYEVEGTGLAGCAMDLAQGQAYQVPVVGTLSAAERAAAVPARNMDLARQYRDQLVQSSNGVTLVSKYYDHNDTVNRILNEDNPFTEVWPYNAPTNPAGQNTSYYMQVTANATANPTDPAYTVGGNNMGYLSHGAYMQGTLIGTCMHYAQQDPDHAEEYKALATDTSTFRGYTSKYPNPMTASAVMSAVQNTQQMSAEELAAIPEPEAVRAGRESAERDFPELLARSTARRAARMLQATTYKSSGSFRFSFSMPTLTFSGNVAITGTPPRENLTVTLTSLVAAVPTVKIELFTGSDPNFTADAQSKINDASWFQQVLGAKLNAKLGSQEVLTYLSNLFNQAIASVLAG